MDTLRDRQMLEQLWAMAKLPEDVVMLDPQFWAGRRVLLTGHTGFKGSWLALWLSQLGAHVHGGHWSLTLTHRCSSSWSSPPVCLAIMCWT